MKIELYTIVYKCFGLGKTRRRGESQTHGTAAIPSVVGRDSPTTKAERRNVSGITENPAEVKWVAPREVKQYFSRNYPICPPMIG